jgi:hypothetical protein
MGWPAIVPHGAQKVVPIAALANPCFPLLTAGKTQGPEQKSAGRTAVHSDVDRYNLVPSYGASLTPSCMAEVGIS